MTITGPLLLPPDVVLTPVAELPDDLRKQFQADEDDVAITRPRSRTPSKIVNPQVAALMRQFREPKTIVAAVIDYCKANRLEPERTLEEAFPVLQRFFKARILVTLGSEGADGIVATYQVGQRVAGVTILHCIQVLEDSELYRVEIAGSRHAALKIARLGHTDTLERALDREIGVLHRLDGAVNPTLLEHGIFQRRPFLMTAWCAGLTVDAAAHALRQTHGFGPHSWSKLLSLAAALADAYAHLHQQGLIHGDVHPRNVLADASTNIKIIDFGLARFADDEAEPDPAPRGGVGFFFEPEYASARMKRRRPPQSTFQGEQYSLAATIYLLFSGGHYLKFSAEKPEMMRQIAEDSPLAFARGGEAWPELEAVLARALSKDPSERFATIVEFARRLRELKAPAPASTPLVATEASPLDRSAAEILVQEMLERVAPDGPLFVKGLLASPVSSVNYGMAGIAYALCRFAWQRQEPRLLAWADLWSTRAAAPMTTGDAFYNPQIQITPATVGRIAFYHTATGVHAVRAIVAHAMCDVVSQQAAVAEFMAAARGECENLDLTLGQSSILIGCSQLAELPTQADWQDRRPLLAFGDEVLAQLWRKLDAMPPIGGTSGLRYLGIAHGWAGILYATLRWCQSATRALPGTCEDRLRQLAAHAEPTGRGSRWRIRPARSPTSQSGGAANYMSGWCNGSSGYIFLWSLANRMLGDAAFLTLAERAAWDAWDQAIDFDSLCCGLAGSSYGLLSLYRQTNDRTWLRRAEDLANRAMVATRKSAMPTSLYKGTLGVAVLASDLLAAEGSSMPLFETEGWPSHTENSRPA